MTILCDQDLFGLLGNGLITEEYDATMLNPASIDVRIGRNVLREESYGRFEKLTLPDAGIMVEPGDFLLVDTMESFNIPNGYGADLRLKSTTARRGWDHSLAFWLDPGYRGRPTMEIRNVLRFHSLLLRPGDRFAQVMVYALSGPSAQPYAGKYQAAIGVEAAKEV